MNRSPAPPLRRRAGLILLVMAAAAVWWGLDHLGPRADWLQVEAPPRAVTGQPLPIRVRLAPLVAPAYLCVDLHWATNRDSSQGYLAGAGAKGVTTTGGTFDFSTVVPPREGLRYVTGIIFLSRTGGWRDRIRVATTDVIPVSTDGLSHVEPRLAPLRVHAPNPDSGDHPRPAALPRLLIALLFLGGAVMSWKAAPSPPASDSPPNAGGRRWRVPPLALALACVWELLGLESWIGARARALALAEDWYYPRAVLQKVMISLVAAATIVFLIFLRRARSSRRLLFASFALYLGISGVNLLSLHAIDKIADLSWYGLSLVQALKLGCALLTVQGVRAACREQG